MRLHECAVELTVDNVVYCYLVQIEPWGECKIHPDKFNVEKEVVAEFVANKANPQQFQECTEYGVWVKRVVNSFHESLLPNGVKHVKNVQKSVQKKGKKNVQTLSNA